MIFLIIAIVLWGIALVIWHKYTEGGMYRYWKNDTAKYLYWTCYGFSILFIAITLLFYGII